MSHSNHDQTENHFLPVIITLTGGERLKGEVSIPHGKNLGELLNGADQFLIFKINDDELIYLAQNTIAIVQSNQIPQARQLDEKRTKTDHAKPHEILDIAQTAGRAVARKAYHMKIRQYHPDQFRNIALPTEVQAYLEAIVLRLNAAYKDFLDEIVHREKLRQMQALHEQQQKKASGGISYFGQ